MKQAVILAGGKGTRLSTRLAGLPKPLIDICGKPLLERQIELLRRYCFTHVLLLVSHGAQYIIDFCASRNNWGIQIDCVDDGEPLGTAGATLAMLPHLEERFLVVYGDTMLDVDLARFEDFHSSRRNVAATLFLHPNDHPSDSDLVDINDEGRVCALYPYPHAPSHFYPNLVNAALYYVNREALEPWSNTRGPFDFGKDLFPAMLKRGAILLGYNSPEYIKDCGTPDRLDKVCGDFASGRVSRSNLTMKQAAIFMDRDGTINHEMNNLSCQDQFALLPGVEAAIKRINKSIYRAVIVTNQPVLARGDCSFQELKRIHNKMETLLGRKGAYLDRIYFCPHHPDRGFPEEITELKIHCSCRKPEVGMIEKAKQELNIDLAQSWLIGDTTVDLLTAHRSGLRSVLVETGFSGLDGRYSVSPDFVVRDLPSAVDFILDDYPKLLNLCHELSEDIVSGGFVFIGGLSCSGKRNLATCLRDSLKLNGKTSVIIPVERWLRNNDERLPGLFGHYAMDEISTILKSLVRRNKSMQLELPPYDRTKCRRVMNTETLQLDSADVVIVEGTFALALKGAVPKNLVQAWFVEIAENERKRRVLLECLSRGMAPEQAEAVYSAQQHDDNSAINLTRDHATKSVDLSFCSA